MVKDDIFLDTPTFLDRVSIDSGIVAFDVAVENAKAITGKNFLINFRGFSPVNIFSKIWYTPKHWIASAINTPIIYFASGTNALNPILRLVKDPEVCDPIRFLREREIVHYQRFGESLRIVQDKLDSKNFYAFNPEFDRKPCCN